MSVTESEIVLYIFEFGGQANFLLKVNSKSAGLLTVLEARYNSTREFVSLIELEEETALSYWN